MSFRNVAEWAPYAIGWLGGSTASGGVMTEATIAAAVLAAAASNPIASDTKRINSVAVIGAGTTGDKWRA